MAHTKSSGAGKYGRDSQPKYLGVKKYHGERVKAGEVIIRQRGTPFRAGSGVKRGGDDTLFAVHAGIVEFETKQRARFDGSKSFAKVVRVATE